MEQNKEYPIDVVIMWVDGSDPTWLAEKRKYMCGSGSDGRVSRYRDWDNLQYLFRGIECFAPWVRHIFFVTCGHLPKWLNVNAPKLRIINHRDYIPAEYLPTFSANPIELNFHRISDLSEHFIFFNDDMFLIRKTKKEDFFKNGQPCDSAVLTAHSHVEDDFYTLGQYRAVGLLNKYFNLKEVLRKNCSGWFNLKYGKMLFRSWVLSGFPRFTGIWQHHLPTSLCKSTIEELWEKEGDKLHETCLNRFRNLTDFTQWLFKDWQLASGNFYPRSVKTGKSFVINGTVSSLDAITYYIERQKGKMVCLNDSEMSDEEFTHAKQIIQQSFHKILPAKSVYERREETVRSENTGPNSF